MKTVSEIIDANSTARSYSSVRGFIREQQLNKSMKEKIKLNQPYIKIKKSTWRTIGEQIEPNRLDPVCEDGVAVFKTYGDKIILNTVAKPIRFLGNHLVCAELEDSLKVFPICDFLECYCLQSELNADKQ